MFGIGPLELILVLAILLLVFGAKRLPEAGRSLGTGMREFKEGITNPAPAEDLSAASDAETKPAPALRSAHD